MTKMSFVYGVPAESHWKPTMESSHHDQTEKVSCQAFFFPVVENVPKYLGSERVLSALLT